MCGVLFLPEWTICNVISEPYPEILTGVGEYKTLGK